jgi:hypothetical protein
VKERNGAGCSSGGTFGELWKTLWNLRIPSIEKKKKMWHACNEILPTYDKLSQRKVLTDPSCPICGLVVETSYHILWDCSSARDAWSECGRKLQKSAFQTSTFIQVVDNIFKICEMEEIKIFVGVAQRL